jgi:glycosyltransferase involved in cell wall biosynthesis
MAARIKAVYDRDAEVVYPPVNMAEFPFSSERDDFYLIVGRLLSYKKMDLAIQTCQNLGRRLLVVGSGPEEARLRAIAHGEVEFLGRVSEPQLKQLYSQARALLYPGYEDFGLIPVEAQATGCPVIAYGAGGVLESVLPDQTGIFFKEQHTAALQEAIARFEKMHFDHAAIRQNAQRFDSEVFKNNIYSIINRYLPTDQRITGRTL